MRSYRLEELFNKTGALYSEVAARAPAGNRRMSANTDGLGLAHMMNKR
jgi:phosphoketolase